MSEEKKELSTLEKLERAGRVVKGEIPSVTHSLKFSKEEIEEVVAELDKNVEERMKKQKLDFKEFYGLEDVDINNIDSEDNLDDIIAYTRKPQADKVAGGIACHLKRLKISASTGPSFHICAYARLCVVPQYIF